MKIYRCDKHDAHNGQLVSWHANYRDAAANLRQHQRDRGGPPSGYEGVTKEDIPTDKAGLISWLNNNFNTDNG